MVPVSHDRTFVFLNTGKTAGTTVEMVLQPFCQPAGTPVEERTPARVSRHGIVGRRLQPQSRWQQLLRRRGRFGHMPARAVGAALGQRRWSRYRKITTIRIPFDAAVSMFCWLLQESGRALPENFSARRKEFEAMPSGLDREKDYAVTHFDGQIAPDRALPEPPPIKKTHHKRIRPLPDYFDRAAFEYLMNGARWAFDNFGYPTTPPKRADSPETVWT